MKAKITFLFVLLLSITVTTKAQDKGLTLLLGPSVNVYYGSPQDTFSYTPDRLSWQLNGTFGLISTRGGTNRGNMLAVFATAGNSNPGVITLMKQGGAEILGNIDKTIRINEFYTLEGGMVIARFLRMSGGVGRQFYTLDTGKKNMLKYFCGTLGISLNLGVVNWDINAQLLTGQDFNQQAVRLNSGFMVKF
jgi:hypothetical protein